MKVAIVHDWLPFMGGAENVLINMHEVFPDAPIYTSICNPGNLDRGLQDANIITTYLQKKGNKNDHRKLFPLLPMAMEHFELSNFDVVLSSSTSIGKCVITGPDTLHICYCNTPMRYAWEFMHHYIGPLQGKGALKSRLQSAYMSVMRVWDYASAARPDVYLANSINVARRIRKYYRRKAYVLHSPVRGSFFGITGEAGDYYLLVSRLQEYKGIGIAVEACTSLKKKLIVVGDGPMKDKLQRMAGNTVQFLGAVKKDDLKRLYSGCRALLFPGVEDFGITPLEAQVSGRPVIAYGRGGVKETVIEGKTGLFFHEPTAESMACAIKLFEDKYEGQFIPEELRQHAMQFDEGVFREKLKAFVEKEYRRFKSDMLEDITIL